MFITSGATIAAGTYSQQGRGCWKTQPALDSQLVTLIKKIYSSAAQLHQCMRAQLKIDFSKYRSSYNGVCVYIRTNTVQRALT